MKKTVNTTEYTYTVMYEPAEEGGFVVTVPALGGVATEGDTLDETCAMDKDAITGYIESLQKDGLDVPLEKEGVAVPVTERVRVALST